MKFILVDRILELAPRERIVTEKALSLAEEYLADHFPKFPVLPGVLMIEALVQSAAWLVRDALDYRPSIVVLKDARNVTYKSFLAPGRVMRLELECKELTDDRSSFQGRGLVGEQEIVKGRFSLRHLTLANHNPSLAGTDERIRTHHRSQFQLLSRGMSASAPVALA